MPEHDREDDQPQLVDQVVFDQRAPGRYLEMATKGNADARMRP
jgi:hypothetical protein